MMQMIQALLLFNPFFIPSDEPLPEGWIGRKACIRCHRSETRGFGLEVHGKVLEAQGEDAYQRSCEACHGPGEAHREDPLPGNIVNYPKDGEAMSEACVSCHPPHGEGWIGLSPEHEGARVACMDCHGGPHKPPPDQPMLAGPVTDLCGSCHQDQAAQFLMPFAHREGKNPAECTACHATHGLEAKSPFFTSSDRESCVSCHPGKAGPFIFPHPPERVEGCGSCHMSHGAGNPFLLTRANITQLCLECHADTPAFHDLSQSRYRSCTACHSAVHGSHREPKLFEE